MSNTVKTRQNELLALDASQATISTATVTIRTLRVNNKQLTQATFRQLPTRHLLDEDEPEIVPKIWGWVNYTPSGEAVSARQFVAQFGEELCRCPFQVRKVSPARGCQAIEDRRRFHWALCKREFMLRALAGDESIRSFSWYEHGQRKPFTVAGEGVFGAIEIGYDSRWGDAMNRYLNPQSRSYWDGNGRVEMTAAEIKEEGRRQLIGHMEQWVRWYQEEGPYWELPGTLPEVRRAMTENSREAIVYALRWNELMDRLDVVPQLFIAV